MNTRRTALIIVGVLIAGFVILQLIPIGSINSDFAFPGNPAVAQAIQWDSPQTEAILRRACYDCHSNETVWPWYSRVAPVSWLVNKDVNEGREELNFSDLEMDEGSDELVEEIEERIDVDMPLPIYLVIHPNATLSEADKQALIEGLQNTFAASSRRSEGEENEARESDKDD